jgi:hypothetical protein
MSIKIPLYTRKVLSVIHKHSLKNKFEVLNSKKCACFHCFRIYDPIDIDTYLQENDGQETALCPLCITDTIIGDASGFNLTDEMIDALACEYFHGLTRYRMKGSGDPDPDSDTL